MVKAQEWLDQNYPKEKREKVTELNIDSQGLKGSLDLRVFSNLEELDCSHNSLAGLDLSGCLNLKIIDCSENKLIKLEISYCPGLQELVCNYNQLTELDVSNCLQLKVIRCGNNQITELNLTGLKQLERVDCNDNFLTNFEYSSLNQEKLVYLNISDNNLSEQDLSVFSNFVNLEVLWVGGDNEEYFSQNICNKFYGSLKPLESLTKLEWLWINNTDIDDGVEYLPSNVESVYCLTEERPESRVKKIVEQLTSSNFELTDKDRGGYNRKGISKDAQEWLNKKYPLGKRTKIKELYIDDRNLEGSLNLEGFVNLKTLCCSKNRINSLNLGINI